MWCTLRISSGAHSGFVDVLKEQCGMDWSVAALARVDYRVYFIFDEAQTLYASNRSGNGGGRSSEWAHFARNGQAAMDWSTG
jgi:hypothetical protein